MVGLILIVVLNVALFFGEFRGNENILNVAIGVMWITATASFFAMFVSDVNLLKEKNKHFLTKLLIRSAVGLTVLHSMYWGYFFAPAVLLVSVLILHARRYELHNRKRF